MNSTNQLSSCFSARVGGFFRYRGGVNDKKKKKKNLSPRRNRWIYSQLYITKKRRTGQNSWSGKGCHAPQKLTQVRFISPHLAHGPNFGKMKYDDCTLQKRTDKFSVERMDNKRLLKKITNAKFDWRSARGRTRFVWMDGVKRALKDRRVSVLGIGMSSK